MNPKVIPTSEVRNRFAEVLENLRKEGRYCLVTKSGQAVAAFLPIEMYEEMMSELEDHLDEKDELLAKEVAETREEYRKGKARKF